MLTIVGAGASACDVMDGIAKSEGRMEDPS
jgi:hypothetical protein